MSPDPLQPLPHLFLDRMRILLGDEYDAFAAALEQSPVSGLRVNTLKLSAAQFQTISPFALGEPVPWCDSAFTFSTSHTPNPSTRTVITVSDKSLQEPGGREAGSREPGRHPYHLAGLYYLQDPSAMSAAELLMCAPYD